MELHFCWQSRFSLGGSWSEASIVVRILQANEESFILLQNKTALIVKKIYIHNWEHAVAATSTHFRQFIEYEANASNLITEKQQGTGRHLVPDRQHHEDVRVVWTSPWTLYKNPGGNEKQPPRILPATLS